MNEIDGVVVRVEDDFAYVSTAGVASACGSCSSRGGCGSADVELGAQKKAHVLRLPNLIHARAGDQVVIQAAQGAVLRAVWWVYLLPLLLAVVGAAGLLAMTGNEMVALLGLLVGLAAGFLGLRRQKPSCNSRQPILSIAFKV
ncbi:MAG: SoxR reducing system RseC family protein [Rhodocyclaceae bacterium]|nr:SoxR reducing system RseC family protein [Rhodocyclaceae bacterium]MDZ4213337.1 SoxR reducing system RseC family protein [Rhodocyclaceae bacterium]